jgi:hypothetical protein
LLVAPLLAANAGAAVSAEESRISIDLVVLIVIALVPILFMIVGCVAWMWYCRREQRSREVRRIQEKKQRRKEVEQHRKAAQRSKGSESSGAHSQQSGSDARSSPQQQDKRWVMPESRLEWIVPQCANQVDGNGSEVMFAVPAVRVVVPQRPRQDTSGRSVQAEAGWIQDVPGTVASSPPRLRGTPSSVLADSNSPSSSISLSEMDNQTYQRPSSSVFPPLTMLA